MQRLNDEIRGEMVRAMVTHCLDALTVSELISAARETVKYRAEDMNDQELYDAYEKLMEYLGHDVNAEYKPNYMGM